MLWSQVYSTGGCLWTKKGELLAVTATSYQLPDSVRDSNLKPTSLLIESWETMRAAGCHRWKILCRLTLREGHPTEKNYYSQGRRQSMIGWLRFIVKVGLTQVNGCRDCTLLLNGRGSWWSMVSAECHWRKGSFAFQDVLLPSEFLLEREHIWRLP